MKTKDKESALRGYRLLMDEVMQRTGKSLTALAEDAGLRHTTLTRPYNGEDRNPPKRETIHKVLVANNIVANELQYLEPSDRAMYDGGRGGTIQQPHPVMENGMDPAEVLIIEALAKRSPERIWELAEAAIRRQTEAKSHPHSAGESS